MQKIKARLILRDQTRIDTEIVNQADIRYRLIDILNGRMQRFNMGMSQFIVADNSHFTYYRLTNNKTLGRPVFDEADARSWWKLVPEEFVLDPSLECFGKVQDCEATRINVNQIAFAQNLDSYTGAADQRKRSKKNKRPIPISITLDSGYNIDGNVLVSADADAFPNEIQTKKQFISIFRVVMYFPPSEHYCYKRYDHILLNTRQIQSFKQPPSIDSPFFQEDRP